MASQQLGSADVAWLRMESPTNPMTITGILAFDRPTTLDELEALVRERFVVFERFRQRIADVDGTPRWETDPHFDLAAHVHRAGLPGAGRKADLQELVSELMSAPLDLRKPPWQMHLVEDFAGGAVLLARLHHTYGDGIALIHVLISMADEYFDPARVPSYGPPERRGGLLAGITRPLGKAVGTAVGTAGGVVTGTLGLARRPGKLLDWTKQGMSVGAAVSKIALLPSDADTVFKGEIGVVKRAAWSQPIALDAVKELAHAVDGKLNDVLLAVVAGGLRRYLAGRGEPVAEVEIGSVIPVNLRPLERAFELGNRFGLVFLRLPVGIEDATERLREVKRRMDQIKHSAEPAVVFAILQAIGAGPELLHEQVVEILSAKTSSVVTNVPGPRERLHFGGRAIERVMFWVPQAGAVGLGISIISYAGEVFLGAATDVKMAPDPAALIAAFEAELAALQDEFV